MQKLPAARNRFNEQKSPRGQQTHGGAKARFHSCFSLRRLSKKAKAVALNAGIRRRILQIPLRGSRVHFKALRRFLPPPGTSLNTLKSLYFSPSQPLMNCDLLYYTTTFQKMHYLFFKKIILFAASTMCIMPKEAARRKPKPKNQSQTTSPTRSQSSVAMILTLTNSPLFSSSSVEMMTMLSISRQSM